MSTFLTAFKQFKNFQGATGSQWKRWSGMYVHAYKLFVVEGLTVMCKGSWIDNDCGVLVIFVGLVG